MINEHNYSITVNWTGNRGSGTSGYRLYDRSHIITIEGKEKIVCSSDAAFLGDKSKHNPRCFSVFK